MSKEREHLKNKITKLYNVFLKNKIKQWKYSDYWFEFGDIGDITLFDGFICIRFYPIPYNSHPELYKKIKNWNDKSEYFLPELYIKSDGSIWFDRRINTMELFVEYELLKKLVIKYV
jgi:activator of HSP90 ATPase